MRIGFHKMQGLGNDFAVFDADSTTRAAIDSHIRSWADRHTGIGFDQALVLEPPRRPGSRVFYRVYNADGTEVEQCGNGARCIAALLYSRQPNLGGVIAMESLGGIVHASLRGDGWIAVDMGEPSFDPASLPMEVSGAPRYSLEIDDVRVDYGAVSMGNPHVVVRVADIDRAPVAAIGPRIENHPAFPNKTNVGFMQIVDATHVRLRVHERGVGETRACGTGACAAVAVGVNDGLLSTVEEIEVELLGGTARVEWAGPGHEVRLSGPASRVFSGSIDI